MADELKSCPFCGERCVIVSPALGGWRVECDGDGDGCGAEIWRTTEQAVVNAWNTRTPSTDWLTNPIGEVE